MEIKPPRNEHELELRLVRLFNKNNAKMLVVRNMMANTIVGQMLPKGAVLKGGGSLRFRYGSAYSRNTMDFDTTRKGDLDEFLKELKTSLELGWNGFYGEVVILPQADPKDVPFDYVMQPIDVKLKYGKNPWCSVRVEVSHSEAGSTDGCDEIDPPEEIISVFEALGFPRPKNIPLMMLEHQVAQKLHGASGQSDKNRRAHDLIDLQLIVANAKLDYKYIKSICENLFRFRRRQTWPTKIVSHPDWNTIYTSQKLDLPVLPTVDEAIIWANDLIAKIAEA